jgi:hypothetical protein
MPEHPYHPSARFLLTLVLPSMALGIGLAMLFLSRSSPDFDINESVETALLVCAIIFAPCYLFARWYSKVIIDASGISARDTLCRWRTIQWESLSRVRRVRIPGLPCVLLSSPESRWSVWLAGSLAPREAFLSTLTAIGPRAATVRSLFMDAA